MPFFINTVHAAGKKLGDAVGGVTQAGNVAGTTGVSDIGTVAGGIIGVALTMIGALFTVLTIYAGYLWMSARGNEDQVQKAMKILMSTVAGFILIVAAWALTVLIVSRYSGAQPAASGVDVGCCVATNQDTDEVTESNRTQGECTAAYRQGNYSITWESERCEDRF